MSFKHLAMTPTCIIQFLSFFCLDEFRKLIDSKFSYPNLFWVKPTTTMLLPSQMLKSKARITQKKLISETAKATSTAPERLGRQVRRWSLTSRSQPLFPPWSWGHVAPKKHGQICTTSGQKRNNDIRCTFAINLDIQNSGPYHWCRKLLDAPQDTIFLAAARAKIEPTVDH